MKVEAIKPVFYAGNLYKQGDVFDLKEGHKLNEKVMRLLDDAEGEQVDTDLNKADERTAGEKARKKKKGEEPNTFSSLNKADERTAAEKAADKVLAE